MSAYACEPHVGSEGGVGWAMAVGMARYADVVVTTRPRYREAIEQELSVHPVEGLRVLYFDPPAALDTIRGTNVGVQVHYYLWQVAMLRHARRLHTEYAFDLAHHVTYVRYWQPTYLTALPVPLVWGPLGGGDTAPQRFWDSFGPDGRRWERQRGIAISLGERDPWVRQAARKSAVAVATTPATAERLKVLGCAQVRIVEQVRLWREQVAVLREQRLGASQPVANGSTVRFVSVANLFAWKGIHLCIEALAQLQSRGEAGNVSYVVIGDGPERVRLETLARELGVAERVRFTGSIPRTQVLELLAEGDVLLHPSFHDSGGFACVEAMALGLPVICLDSGGPAQLVLGEAGIRLPVSFPDQVRGDLSAAMERLVARPSERSRMGRAAQDLVAARWTWEAMCEEYRGIYDDALA